MLDTLEVEDRVPNQPALHQTPTHRTGLQKGPPLCLLGDHGTHCGTSTAIFSVNDSKLGLRPLHTPTIDGLGRFVIFGHCLKPSSSPSLERTANLPLVNRGSQSLSTIVARVLLRLTNGPSLFSKDSWISHVHGSYWARGLLLRPLERHGDHTDSCVLMDTMAPSLRCSLQRSVGLHGRSFQQLS